MFTIHELKKISRYMDSLITFWSKTKQKCKPIHIDSCYMRSKWSESVNCSSFLTLCDPMDCSLLGSSVHGILQARILEWVAIPFSRGSSRPRDWTHLSNVSCITGRFFTTGATCKAKQNKNPDQMIVKVLSENLWLVSTSLDKLTSRGFHLMKFWEILLKSVPKWK